MKTFGEWVYERRTSKGLTQDEVGQKAGVSKAYISAVENNKPVPSGRPQRPFQDTVCRIARALGESEREGLILAGYGFPDTADREHITTLYNELTKDDRIRVNLFVEALHRYTNSLVNKED